MLSLLFCSSLKTTMDLFRHVHADGLPLNLNSHSTQLAHTGVSKVRDCQGIYVIGPMRYCTNHWYVANCLSGL